MGKGEGGREGETHMHVWYRFSSEGLQRVCVSAQFHQLSLSLRPGGQRTGVPCVQFLSAFQIIANEPNAPFPSLSLQRYYCHLQAARGRALWRYGLFILQVYVLIPLKCLGFNLADQQVTAHEDHNRIHCGAPTCISNLVLFFLSQARAAPSAGAKRRGRPKKEVRVLGRTV